MAVTDDVLFDMLKRGGVVEIRRVLVIEDVSLPIDTLHTIVESPQRAIVQPEQTIYDERKIWIPNQFKSSQRRVKRKRYRRIKCYY